MATDANPATEAETVPETSTDTKATEPEKAADTSKSNAIPYDRFKEVVDQKNEVATRYEALEQQFTQKSDDLTKMIALLEAKDNDAAIVAAIREFAKDGNPAHRELVENLDKMLTGADEDEDSDDSDEKSEQSPKSEGKELKKLVNEAREELAEHAADQQADLLLMKADTLAEKYFDALPDQYTDQDKQVISKLLTDDVNWETIEENPDSLSEEIAGAFERTLESFGTPRGEVASEEVANEEKTTEAEKNEPEVPEHMLKDWGELKEVKLPGGETLQPIHSDDDFAAALAQEIRRSRS